MAAGRTICPCLADGRGVLNSRPRRRPRCRRVERLHPSALVEARGRLLARLLIVLVSC
jgi:hypothetical protein